MKFPPFSIFIIAVIFSACSTTEKRNGANMSDPGFFTQGAYDSLRTYFRSDTAFMAILQEGVQQNDSNAIKAKKLIEAPYDRRSESGYTDEEIAGLIQAFGPDQMVYEELREMQETMQAEQAAADSVLKTLEK
jgi:hypothetical protein